MTGTDFGLTRARRVRCAPSAATGAYAVAVALLLTVLLARDVRAQGVTEPITGRAVIDALDFEPLNFEQPVVDRHTVSGVQILLLEDHELPLVSVHAYFRGGYGRFAREYYAPAMGLPAMLRYGGTTGLAPDSVDQTIDYYALQMSFGSAGGSVTATVNTLTEHLDTAVRLWGAMLASPRFDANEIAAWRGRQLESVLRRRDDPGRLAFSQFNRLLYGDHPVGWEMDADDLEPELLTPDRFHAVHRRIVCRDNLVLGVTGDVSWTDIESMIGDLLKLIPPCAEELPESPTPDIRREAGVFLIERKLEQAVIVMAHPTRVQLADDIEYFSAVIGNSILGGGGLSSRMLRRVRTEKGFAYSAASLWTTPRKHEGIVGAITRTRPENAIPAIEVILATMDELRDTPPTDEEVKTTIDQIVNGFVFNFDTPAQIVARSMFYLAQDLPGDWLDRYWRGVQEVTPESIRAVFAQHLRPHEMTILIVGDLDRIGRAKLEALGPLTILDVR